MTKRKTRTNESPWARMRATEVRDLSPSSLGVLIVLRSRTRPPHFSEVSASLRDLESWTGYSRPTCSTALKELVTKGYLSSTQEGRGTTIYKVLLDGSVVKNFDQLTPKQTPEQTSEVVKNFDHQVVKNFDHLGTEVVKNFDHRCHPDIKRGPSLRSVPGSSVASLPQTDYSRGSAAGNSSRPKAGNQSAGGVAALPPTSEAPSLRSGAIRGGGAPIKRTKESISLVNQETKTNTSRTPQPSTSKAHRDVSEANDLDAGDRDLDWGSKWGIPWIGNPKIKLAKITYQHSNGMGVIWLTRFKTALGEQIRIANYPWMAVKDFERVLIRKWNQDEWEAIGNLQGLAPSNTLPAILVGISKLDPSKVRDPVGWLVRSLPDWTSPKKLDFSAPQAQGTEDTAEAAEILIQGLDSRIFKGGPLADVSAQDAWMELRRLQKSPQSIKRVSTASRVSDTELIEETLTIDPDDCETPADEGDEEDSDPTDDAELEAYLASFAPASQTKRDYSYGSHTPLSPEEEVALQSVYNW